MQHRFEERGDISHKLRIFRPHRTPPQELEKTLVGRDPLLNEILEKLENWETGKSRQHYLFIGPRGIGKTNLINLIDYRIGKNPHLNKKWYTVSFSEDSYGITRVTDILIEALHVLSNKTQDKNITSVYENVKYDDNEKRVTDLALDAFRQFHLKNRCGILFMLENMNRVLENRFKQKDEIHLLRKILIEEEWIVFIITSPTYLNAVTRPEEPLFEFFKVKFLEELTPQEQQEMLYKIALLEENTDFIENYLNKLRPQLHALYHFTGGNPRLTVMLYDLVAHKHLMDVKTELDSLLDKLTPFYQDRMKEIGEQEAKLLEKMALMEEGCTPTELAKELRSEQNIVRALLTRMERSGYVRREQRRLKSTVYIIPERFFRIWHQMNHSRAARGRIQYLIEFFTSWYAEPEEREQVWNELMDALQEHLYENNEEKTDEINEYMQYIEAISIGAATALGRIGSELAVQPLIDHLKNESQNVRISSMIALGKIAQKKPFQNIDLVIRFLVKLRIDASYESRILEALRNLIDSAFRLGDIETIAASIDHIKHGVQSGEEFLKPYAIALNFIKSGRDISIIERQQPEMREAVLLLVDAFDNNNKVPEENDSPGE